MARSQRVPAYVFKELFGRLPKRTGWQPVLSRACLVLFTPVNSAYGRTGNATATKPRLAANSVAAAATEPAHSPDAAARAAQPGSTGNGNKSGAGRVAGGFRS